MPEPRCMSAGQINKALDRLDKVRSKIVDAFIAAGRGNERSSEIMEKSDPLARKYQKVSREYMELQHEVSRRYGPNAPSRLPKGRGYGPLQPCPRK